MELSRFGNKTHGTGSALESGFPVHIICGVVPLVREKRRQGVRRATRRARVVTKNTNHPFCRTVVKDVKKETDNTSFPLRYYAFLLIEYEKKRPWRRSCFFIPPSWVKFVCLFFETPSYSQYFHNYFVFPRVCVSQAKKTIKIGRRVTRSMIWY